jgi:tetratricopeptide (TPR) repeat protein
MRQITLLLLISGVAAAQEGQPYPYPYYPPQPPPTPPSHVAGDPYAPPPVTYRAPRMMVGTQNEDAAKATWVCADALDQKHLDLARMKCKEALQKDESIAFAHLLYAQTLGPEQARVELTRALELSRRASPGERYFVEAHRAIVDGRMADARRLHDALVQTLPGEPRAFLVRARLRRELLGDLDGAISDLRHAVELEKKYTPAWSHLPSALAERGQLDEAVTAAKKYLEVLPSEPNAHVTLARLLLRKGEVQPAIAAAKNAVGNDDKFPPARQVLGDALLFAGKGKEARKEYGVLVGTDDPAIHHDGAMRSARSWLFEGRPGEAEKAMLEEADLAKKTKRPGDQADALVELARLQVDRGALADAGQALRQAGEVLSSRDVQMSDDERRRLVAESLYVRAMVLAAIGERQLAEARAEEVEQALGAALDPRAAERARALRGWIAARNHDDKSALANLSSATRPTLKMALALAIQRSGDGARARSIMEELAKQVDNDLETALSRPRAVAWLRATK